MQLYFIRHGQSQNNAHWNDPNYKESPDPALTEIGIEQARILAEYLQKISTSSPHPSPNTVNLGMDGEKPFVYTSLMERAVHTAAPTVRSLRIPFAAWTEIHESGGIFGRDGELKLKGLAGKPRSYFEENFPELTLPVSLDGTGWWNNRPFEMEEECHQRAERVWVELLARHGDKEGQPEQRVVFFSHGGFFVHLICAMLDLPWRQASNGFKSWFLLSNCSISRFDIRNKEVTICYLNRTDHLPDHLITG